MTRSSDNKTQSAPHATSTSGELTRQIDENLKRLYHESVEDELPDRFKVLLEKLKQSDTRS